MESVKKRDFSLKKNYIKVIKEMNEVSTIQDEHEEPGSLNIIYDDEINDKINSTEFEVEHLCRICLLSKEFLISSLSETYKDLLDMYLDVTSIAVNSESQGALQICETCKNELTFCYNFKNKCQKSDLIFKTLISEVNANEDDGARNVKNATKIENGTVELKEEVDEHEDVQYLDDSLDFDMFDDNKEDITLNIVMETKRTVRNKAKVSVSDSKRLRKISKVRQKYSLCTMCPKRFLKAKTLKAHMKSEHRVQLSHSCSHCKKSFSSEHDLHLHLPIHSKTDAWTCIECHKKFNDKTQFKRHIERHMEIKRHACAACGKMFAELYSLRRHERVHTGETPDKPHACHLCDKRYRYRALLAAHMVRHTGARPCACAACGKTFASPRLLASHRLVHTEHKPHKCHYCDKTFRHESTRNTHHRTHTGEKPHVCALCGKTFIQRSNLIRHMRTHTGERPYTCKVCERKFGCGSSLKNHMRSHTGDKPYHCTVCNKRFARNDMRAHMAQHTGERPHACTACGKRFARAWRLREHSRMHTGEKPFECANCNDKFSTKSQLMKHFKIHQKGKKSVEKGVIVFRHDIPKPYVLPDKILFSGHKTEIAEDRGTSYTEDNAKSDLNIDSKIVNADEMPLEVIEEVVLQDGGDKTELMVQNSEAGQYLTNLRDEGEDYVSGSLKSNIHYVKMTDDGPNISSTAVVQGGAIKLYQLDQSVVRIHRSGRQLTVRKVTSKMTNV